MDRQVDWQNRPLYLITDGFPLRFQGRLVSTIHSVLEAAAGAVSCVQVREQGPKHPATDGELLEILQELKPICAEFQVKLIVSRRIDLALKADIDGVQCGADSPSLREYREQYKNKFLLGYSAHSPEEALRAFDDGAAYVLLSPIFPLRSKFTDRCPLGVSTMQSVRARTDGVLIALGGIDWSNAASCRESGADGIAVVSSVFAQANPADCARRINAAWLEGISINAQREIF